MDRPTCESCIYFKASRTRLNDLGQCHVQRPRASRHAENDRADWPQVFPDEFCPNHQQWFLYEAFARDRED